MPDYSKGQIYTIRCRTDDTKIYVGSTIQPLYKRFYSHKIDSKKEKCMNVKLYIEVNGNWDDWYIELYENLTFSFPYHIKMKVISKYKGKKSLPNSLSFLATTDAKADIVEIV